MKTYAGIGSRKTPLGILILMTLTARLLSGSFRLNSGGADGADTAFELGAGDNANIFLPWPGFNNSQRRYEKPSQRLIDEAEKIMESVHPAWGRLSQGARKLHTRNCFQALGQDLRTPVKFVLCWTPDGAYNEQMCTSKTGGTGTAIKLASRHGIEVFNLKNEQHLQRILDMFAKQSIDVKKHAKTLLSQWRQNPPNGLVDIVLKDREAESFIEELPDNFVKPGKSKHNKELNYE